MLSIVMVRVRIMDWYKNDISSPYSVLIPTASLRETAVISILFPWKLICHQGQTDADLSNGREYKFRVKILFYGSKSGQMIRDRVINPAGSRL